MQQSDGANNHGIFILPPGRVILPLRRMFGATGEQIEGVGKQREDGAQGALGAAWIAGKVENKGVTQSDADSATESRKGRLAKTVLANEFGDAWDEPG